MAMDLMLALSTLVEQGELEEGSDIGALAGEGDEDRHVKGVVFCILAIRVEVDRPLVTSHCEGVAGDIFARPHALGERVAADGKIVRAVDRFCDRA